MLLQKIVIEGIMPERALSKLQREGICVYHAKKLKKNQILLSAPNLSKISLWISSSKGRP